jgi:signal peptidase I
MDIVLAIAVFLGLFLLVLGLQPAIVWLAARVCRVPGVSPRRAVMAAVILIIVSLAALPLYTFYPLANGGVNLVAMWLVFQRFLRATRWKATGATLLMWIFNAITAIPLALAGRNCEETFVVPTGAMAPTIMGRHKDVVCPKCGCPYQVNASVEVDNAGNSRDSSYQVVAGTCPMCRYTASLSPDNPRRETYSLYHGDRLLVSKFAYKLAGPERWDVIAFGFPGDAVTSRGTPFIKRLVGLPGDTVWIQHGDVWIRHGQEPFQIARKPPEKLLALLQPVFDNDYMPQIAKLGWPAPLAGRTDRAGERGRGLEFRGVYDLSCDGTARGESWLRYHHLAPDFQQWREMVRQGGRPPKLVPQLIRDFTAYDTGRLRREERMAPDIRATGPVLGG